MAETKEVIIYDANPQTVRASRNMGMLLLHNQVRDIVEDFGSRVIQDRLSGTIDIVPPLPSEKLPDLGQAIIGFALQFDDTPPPPTYRIL